MPRYEHPGVYIEEIPFGAKPIEGVSTSTAGFIGATERGPLGARLVTSLREYSDRYGGEAGPGAYLPYAVRGYFENGGRLLYVGRVVSASATCASAQFGPHFTLQAIAPGAWGQRVFACIDDSVTGAPGFRLRVVYFAAEPAGDPHAWFDGVAGAPAPACAEEFDGLVLDADLPDHFDSRLAASNLVRLRSSPAAPADAMPAYALRRLGGGTDGAPLEVEDFEGSASSAEPHGLAAFASGECRDVSLLYAPGASVAVARCLLAHCEAVRYRFAILDGPATLPAGFDPRRDIAESSRAALYAPWLVVGDLAAAAQREVPPGGHVAGIYARTDATKGVHTPPANEEIVGALGLTARIDAGQQEALGLRGVNALRAFPGRGLRVWGARTLSADPQWKYVNVRRLFIYLERSIENCTQWVVFEPSGERLWSRVRAIVGDFLRVQWRNGALAGRTEEEAFFVRCDRTTMTQNDVDRGRLICEVGVAPIRPAEFVVLRLALGSADGNA